MDDLDRKLIAALRRDARLPLSDLAKHLGVAHATARSRIERLLSRGDILGFTVLTREDVARSPVRGLMMLKIEGSGTDRILHRLTGFPEVSTVHTTNGNWDLIAEIGTNTLEALDKILFEIRRLDGVTSSETNLLLTTRKQMRIRYCTAISIEFQISRKAWAAGPHIQINPVRRNQGMMRLYFVPFSVAPAINPA